MVVPKLGELLISKGLITNEQFMVAMSQQEVTGNLLGDTLVELSFLSSMEMGQALAEQAGIEFIDGSRYPISEDALNMVPKDTAENAGFLPLELQNGILSIGITDPSNIRAIDIASHISGKPPNVFMMDSDTFYAMIEKAYFFLKHPIAEKVKGITEGIKKGKEISGDIISKLTELLVMDGIRRNGTDIHITPEAKALHVFCRVDGVLQHIYCLPKAVHSGVISRLKILSNLDIAEQRLPQDGSFTFKLMNNVYEMRLSSIPTIYGENIVIRILSGSSPLLSMTNLGFDGQDAEKLRKLFSKPHGLIIIAGPTGSGKTTTLYSALREINIIERNVLTVEDPIEYKLSLVKQTQVSSKTGYGFALAGRSFMRQDPDAMLIGEIRDEDTASIAMRASITGHLVLSTIHTNDAATSVPRLVDLSIDRFLLSSALLAVVAQRLVRKVCIKCAETNIFEPGELEDMGFSGVDEKRITARRGAGCGACNQTGYLGRTVIGEILIVDDGIKDMIYAGESANAIKERAVKNGMMTIRGNGIKSASKGITTFDEVLRVVG